MRLLYSCVLMSIVFLPALLQAGDEPATDIGTLPQGAGTDVEQIIERMMDSLEKNIEFEKYAALASIDSASEEKVNRLEAELKSYWDTAEDFDRTCISLILLKSATGWVALFNYKTLHILERSRALELVDRGDTLITLKDYELWRIVMTMIRDVEAVEGSAIQDSQHLTGLLEQPAAVQAARDLVNTWQDIRAAMVAKSPYVQLVLESGVLKD